MGWGRKSGYSFSGCILQFFLLLHYIKAKINGISKENIHFSIGHVICISVHFMSSSKYVRQNARSLSKFFFLSLNVRRPLSEFWRGYCTLWSLCSAIHPWPLNESRRPNGRNFATRDGKCRSHPGIVATGHHHQLYLQLARSITELNLALLRT